MSSVRCRRSIRSGVAGLVASCAGLTSVAIYPLIYLAHQEGLHWIPEWIGLAWFGLLSVVLIAGSVLGVGLSLYALCVRPSTYAVCGLCCGCVGLLFIPTFCLTLFVSIYGV